MKIGIKKYFFKNLPKIEDFVGLVTMPWTREGAAGVPSAFCH